MKLKQDDLNRAIFLLGKLVGVASMLAEEGESKEDEKFIKYFLTILTEHIQKEGKED